MRGLGWGIVLLGIGLATACGGDSEETTGPGGSSTTSTSGMGGQGATGGGGGSTGGGGSSSSGGGGAAAVHDPNLDGPYAFTELDDSTVAAATGNQVAIHCAYPTGGPSAGPYPVILFGHGFQLPPSQYYGYLRRLATFGYVALTVDFPAGMVFPNHVNNAAELLAGLDWAAGKAELAGVADPSWAGATGHSLGGKLSLLAATMDGRIQATITLDPVDSSMGCTPQDCPDVSAMMPLNVPTGFIGELIDATGSLQACAPAADNFETFYAGTTAPSLSVDVLGANHMSFIEDVGSCGLPCSFCNAATAPQEEVLALSRAFVVAFYERYLKGHVGYDTYLTGAEAVARYVDTGQATIASK